MVETYLQSGTQVIYVGILLIFIGFLVGGIAGAELHLTGGMIAGIVIMGIGFVVGIIGGTRW